MFTDNQKALAVFTFLLLALGCAGHGDYQDAKRHEVKMCK